MNTSNQDTVKHHHNSNNKISNKLTPSWSSDATDEQKRILTKLINDMILVEGGTFTMGARPEKNEEAYSRWYPGNYLAHRVTLSDYFIGKYSVTQEQWEAVMGYNPSYRKGEDYPVESVTWYECQNFIKELNRLSGFKFSLPTEAQWEFAARGGNKSYGYIYSGSNNVRDVAWCREKLSNTTHPVGKKRPNELGLYDMSGNVYEWCLDYYDEDYYSSSPEKDPQGPATGTYRVKRGGAYNTLNTKQERHHEWMCLVWLRIYWRPEASDNDSGLRLVLTDCISTPQVSTKSFEKKVKFDNGLIPTWAPCVTAEQKRVLKKLIKDMTFVDGGTFTMGIDTEKNRLKTPTYPPHRVTLSDYYIGKYVITQQQWLAIMGYNPPHLSGANKPVVDLKWHECHIFIRELNRLTGLKFRLPTEAQWEFAARGGNKTHGYKYSGSDNFNDVAWDVDVDDDEETDKTHPVGRKLPNELGLYDMTGNVYEWCSDIYSSSYYREAPENDPQGPPNNPFPVCHVLRGNAEVFRRSNYNFRKLYIGFRLALDCSDNYASADKQIKDKIKFANGLTLSCSPKISSWRKGILTEILNNMVFVKGGTFTMGATPEQESAAYPDEYPAHDVNLSDYYISKYLVTQIQWEAIMGENPSVYGIPVEERDRCPVECISWGSVFKFISKLKRLTGCSFNLPTEAQWEFAARGGIYSRGYKYSGGNIVDDFENLEDIAWFSENSSNETHPVGYKRPNELGLYDMTGNVWEMCLDYYDPEYYRYSPIKDPQGPATGAYRVLRGSSCFEEAQYGRVSERNWSSMSDSVCANRGFRLVVKSRAKPDSTILNPNSNIKLANGLSPSWAPDVSDAQKCILTELINDMILVEGGAFAMGATPEQESNACPDECSTHQVMLSNYYIGKFTVTLKQWDIVMSPKSPHRLSTNPTEKDWDDCKDFIRELNRLTGLKFRLPTEAQWEFAARGGNKSRGYKYAGSDNLEDVAWFCDNSSEMTHPVGEKQPNELGLYDMSGNVMEWCADFFDENNCSQSQDNESPTSTGERKRVARGGACLDNKESCRVSYRGSYNQKDYNKFIGMRLIHLGS